MASELETRVAGGHTDRRRLRVPGTVLAWLLILGLGYAIWPSSLGGHTTMILVNGESMEPTYRTGDIVVARSGTPRVGDIVVYTTEDLGDAKIIHRITGGDGRTGWQLEGDNNDFVDPFRPTNAEVLGIARLHIPAVGTWAAVLQNPSVWLSLLLLALGLTIWPSAGRREHGDDDDLDAEPESAS